MSAESQRAGDPAAAGPASAVRAVDDPTGGGYHPPENPTGKRLALLSLTALGIVYGDIGTSPLYAMKEAFNGRHGLQPTQGAVYGILSLIVWSLILIVSVKYIALILRADNRGEGGIMALLALLLQQERRSTDRRRRTVLTALALFGAALLYGDGIITPAVSVLSAVEGLEVAAPALHPFVLPLAFGILLALFLVQRFGTARVGVFFGPVTLVWFVTIAALGTMEILRGPEILSAVNPVYAVRFFAEHGLAGFLVLGAVVLTITGAEALYADMGHFGRRPIRLAWTAVALPALLLNYFGQGALLLRTPAAAENPFYMLAPGFFVYPLIAIATAAAIIASQALISGAFSLIQQSIQLGYSPRMTIVHTSEEQAGQIYVPEINKALMVGTLLLVLGFRTSIALAAAYGIATTITMAVTTVLFCVVARTRWEWPLWSVWGIAIVFLSIDLAFLAANTVKIIHGGWVPIAIAMAVFTLMSTWKRGRRLLNDILKRGSLPMELFLEDVARRKPVRVSGTAVFMTSSATGAPVVLLHHLKHNKVLHETVVLLSIKSRDYPEVPPAERVTVESLGEGFWRVRADYGFMQTPDVKEIFARAREAGVTAKPQETTYYLGRERLIVGGGAHMMKWRKRLFTLMARNAQSATEFFGIPSNRVVELGAQIDF